MIKLKPSNKTLHGLDEDGDFCFSGYDSNGEPSKMFFRHPQCKLGTCDIGITKGEAKHPMWHWDGNKEAPTISPSIGCDNRCGLHFSITNGIINP